MLHQIITELHKTLSHREWHFLLAAYETNRRRWQHRAPLIAALTSHAWGGSTTDNMIDTLTTRKLLESRRTVHPGTNIGTSLVRVTPDGADLIKRALQVTPPILSE